MVKYAALVFVLVASVPALVSCSKSKDDDKSATTGKTPTKPGKVEAPVAPKVEAKLQWYRAELALESGGPGAALFFLQVPLGGAKGEAVVRTGEHDLKAEHRWDGDKLVVPFTLFHTELTATRAADGTLSGAWNSASRTWGKASLAFKATPIDKPAVAQLRTDDYKDKPTGAFTGVWKLAMKDGATRLKLAVKPDGDATGSFSFPSGAHLHLGGVAAGDKVRLSGFDGTSVYLVQATVTGDTIKMDWAAGQDFSWSETLSGERVKDFEMQAGPRLIQGADNLELADFDVKTLLGKPTIVELAGSWCITCKFVAPFLVKMYDKYQPQGLQMVTLTYEFTDDDAYNKKAAADFKRDYGIKWEVIAMMGDLEEAAEILPLTLEGMELGAFPYSIFLSPEGKVIDIHAGFPAIGSAEYKEATAEYEKKVQALLSTAKK